MSQYKFRLQKVLDIRKQKEEKAKIAFTNAALDKKSEEDKRDDLLNNYKRFNNSSRSETIIEQKIRFHYLCSLTASIEAAEKEIVKKSEILEKRRMELKDRQIERKTVEILRDKSRDAFIKEENRKEQISIDEFALYGFIRNMKGGEEDAG